MWLFMGKKVCSVCGKEFIAKTARKVCYECGADRTCIVCGAKMSWRHDKYCSKKCAAIGWSSNLEAHKKIAVSVKKFMSSLTDEQKEERSKRLSELHKQRYIDNPELLKTKSEKMKEHWKNDTGKHREAFGGGCSRAVKNRWLDTNRVEFYRSVYGDLPESTLVMLDDIDALQRYVDSLPVDERTSKVVANKLGLPLHAIASRAEYAGLKLERTAKSSYETMIAGWLRSIGIKFIENDRTVLNGKELDFYIPEHNLALEFNGLRWHSVQHLSIRNGKDAVKYHQNKSLACREKGIRLIHIWENEWDDVRVQERIKSQILGACGMSERVFARKCTLREMTNVESNEFFDLNSQFMHKRGVLKTFGLYYGDKCVMAYAVSFKQTGRGSFERRALEIARSATALNMVVVGGASRLMKAVKEWAHENYPNISELHYFVDFDKHCGSSLEAVGAEFVGVTPPSIRIMFSKPCELVSRDGDKFSPVPLKIYSRMPIFHKAVEEQDALGNLTTLANAGTLHYKFAL